MKLPFIATLAIGLMVLGSACLSAAELATAKVFKIEGSAILYSSDGTDRPLQRGDILKQGDGVVSAPVSSVTLVFSNGSMLTVEENSSITMESLSQDAFAGGKEYEQLSADPSKSNTLVGLNYGKVSGEVKKLQNGSSFDVRTPLGTAAIRGTIYWVSLFFNSERGEFVLIIHNANGIVDVISRYAGQLDFGRNNTADTNYQSGGSEEKREVIPPTHYVIIRLSDRDPYFDTLIDEWKNNAAKKGPPFTPPGPPPWIPVDPGTIVVSPEGPVPPGLGTPP